MRPHLEALAANHIDVLLQLQRRFHGANCPAVAAAVHNYLLTGQIHRASANGGLGFVCSPALQTRRSIRRFINMVRGGPIGNCAVICTRKDGKTHFFNLVKLDLGVHYVDAYSRPPYFETEPGTLTEEMDQYQFFRDFSCRGARPEEVRASGPG